MAGVVSVSKKAIIIALAGVFIGAFIVYVYML